MSHPQTITAAIAEAGGLTRAELLDATGIKHTVLDATLSKLRTRGRIARCEDTGRWLLLDGMDQDDTPAADSEQPAEAAPPQSLQTPRPVINYAAGQLPTAPARTEQPPREERPRSAPVRPAQPDSPEHLVQVGRLRIAVTGCSEADALLILAAAVRTAADIRQ